MLHLAAPNLHRCNYSLRCPSDQVMCISASKVRGGFLTNELQASLRAGLLIKQKAFVPSGCASVLVSRQRKKCNWTWSSTDAEELLAGIDRIYGVLDKFLKILALLHRTLLSCQKGQNKSLCCQPRGKNGKIEKPKSLQFKDVPA